MATVISTNPSRNAPMRYLLFQNLLVKITGLSDLQLNPWKSLLRTQRAESHGASQESASAQLRSGEPAVEPYEEGQNCHHTYGNSAYPDLGQKSLVRMDSLAGRGFSFISSLL